MLAAGQTVSSPTLGEGGNGEVSEFSQAHGRSAVETLVEAFADDPVTAHLFPDAARRRVGMAEVFRIQLRYGQRYGRVELAKSAGAVAVWIRPEHTTPSWTQMVRVGLLTAPFTLGWSATRRMLRFMQFITDCRMRTMGGPHWYLACLGVQPDHQGQGLGAVLVQHGLQRIQSSGVPGYLETAKESNLPFYQKHGFQVVGRKQVPDAGPGIWRLVAGGGQ